MRRVPAAAAPPAAAGSSVQTRRRGRNEKADTAGKDPPAEQAGKRPRVSNASKSSQSSEQPSSQLSQAPSLVTTAGAGSGLTWQLVKGPLKSAHHLPEGTCCMSHVLTS